MADTAEAAPRQRPRAQAGEPDPYGDDGGIAYLLARGWKCLGPRDWPSSQWLDPEKPLVEKYTREPIKFVQRQRVEERQPGGTVRVRYVEEERQLTVQDGTGSGAMTPAMRTVYHPAVVPISLQQALWVQIERDAAAERKRLADEQREKEAREAMQAR